MFNFSRSQLAVSGTIVGVTLILTVCLAVRSDVFGRQQSQIKFTEPEPAASIPIAIHESSPAKPQAQGICVHVAGKVKSPGVYFLRPGSRVVDAIKAAGGGLHNADLDSINLAQKLNDGEQVYVAQAGKVPPVLKSGVVGTPATSHRSSRTSHGEGGERRSHQKLTTPGQGTVNINSASADSLQKLPGIGPAMAQRILDYRTQNGRFKAVDELQEVRGIGPAKMEKIRPFVSL